MTSTTLVTSAGVQGMFSMERPHVAAPDVERRAGLVFFVAVAALLMGLIAVVAFRAPKEPRMASASSYDARVLTDPAMFARALGLPGLDVDASMMP